MTKEDLSLELNDVAKEVSAYRIEGILQRFFDSNVCIPKGVNRHPYADILHEAVEDLTLQLETIQDRATFAGWVKSTIFAYPKDKYRIKPSEPTYEWQWITIEHDGKVDTLGKYYTQEEFDAEKWQTQYYTFVKIEETKRVR